MLRPCNLACVTLELKKQPSRDAQRSMDALGDRVTGMDEVRETAGRENLFRRLGNRRVPTPRPLAAMHRDSHTVLCCEEEQPTHQL